MKTQQLKNGASPSRAKVPKLESWATTDAEEIRKRRERAAAEPMKVRAVDVSGGFGIYEVSRPAADHRTAAYRVELRSLDEPINTCNCPDFVKNGLGTCKHIERVLKFAARKCGKSRQSTAAEVFIRRPRHVPVLLLSPTLPPETRRALARHCAADGTLRDASAAGLDVFLRACDRLNAVRPDSVRVSHEIRRHLADLTRREALVRAVDEFRDDQGTDTRWPFLKKSLFPYQQDGALHLARKGRAILADEMGLGKTVQAIAAALLLREAADVRHVLVIVPASLKGEWDDQIRLFSDATVELLFGARAARLERYAKTAAFFLVANYEQAIRDWKEINDTLKPDLVILDEAQRIKNWKTKTARNLKALSSPYAFVLTGTPLENRIDELYSLVEFVDPTLFGSLFRFNRRFYAFDKDGHNTGMKDLAELHDAVSGILLRRRKSAVEDELPGRMSKTYKTSMTPEQSRRYDEHLHEVATLYALSRKRPLSPKEQERLQRELAMMRMLCDSCYIMDPEIRDSPKLDEFEEILDDIFADEPSRKVIVFSEWARMLDLLAARLEAKDIGFALHTGQVPQKRRREEIRRFKEDPSCRVFLASESGGVGLNLQAASVVVNLDMPWNPARLEQRIARAWRKHQKRDVLVVNMVAAGTIEERMLQTLDFKQGLADFVLDAQGDAADFERLDAEEAKGRRKESAFMQRLASVMGDAVKVRPDPSPRTEPVIPPDERLRAEIAAECPGVERLLLGRSGDAADRAPTAAVFVGSGIDQTEAARRIAGTHGTALPDSAVEIVSPETWAIIERLRDLGVIQFRSDVAKPVFVREPADAAKAAAARRVAAARRADSEAERLLKMGELLVGGGFAGEGQAALRKAVALAAGAARQALGAVPESDSVAPVSSEDFQSAVAELDLRPEFERILEASVFSRDIPDPIRSARAFVENCRLSWQ